MLRSELNAGVAGWVLGVGCHCAAPGDLPPGSGDSRPTIDLATADTATGPWLAVAAGSASTCGILADGVITCWGSDFGGRTAAPPGRFVGLGVSTEGGCGLLESGYLSCWDCQDPDDSQIQVECIPPDGVFEDLDVSSAHGCARRGDGLIACWGGMASGPFELVSMHVYTSYDTAENWTCGILADGSPECFGFPNPGQEPPAGQSYLSVAIGQNHMCGIGLDGSGSCWGVSTHAVAIPQPPPGTYIDMDSHANNTCGLRSDGSVECWGPESEQPDPKLRFRQISVGFLHQCGVTIEGEVACWGRDSEGETEVPDPWALMAGSAGSMP